MDGYENAVFVSYAWGGESERTVDDLERAFAMHGIRIVRDKKDLDFKGSIEAFEQRISQGQCVLLVISDKYLRSEHCMYELVKTAENQKLQERIFPIVLADVKIYKAVDRLIYIKHWDEQIAQLNQAIRDVGMMTNIANITADLDKYARIRANIDHLIDLLGDMNTLTPEIHTASGFATLVNAVEKAMKLDSAFSQPSENFPERDNKTKKIANNSHAPNPFTPLSGMIDQERFFYGRRLELDLIFEYLNSGSSVVLIGNKAVGKSSLLHAICRQAENMLNQSRKGIYLNLESISSDKEFFAGLCYLAGIKECSGFALNRALKEHKLLIAIDEVEKMTWKGFSREIRSQLRGLAQEGSDPPIRLVMASSTPLDRLFPDSQEAEMTSPLANICTQVDIGNWDKSITASFILNRLSNTGIDFTPDEISLIFEQSHGHPQKVMQVSYHTFSNKSKQ